VPQLCDDCDRTVTAIETVRVAAQRVREAGRELGLDDATIAEIVRDELAS